MSEPQPKQAKDSVFQKEPKCKVEVISFEGEHFKLPLNLPLLRDMLEDCGESEEAIEVPLTSEVLKCFLHYNSNESQRRHLLELANRKKPEEGGEEFFLPYPSPYFEMLPLTKDPKYIIDVLMMNVAADFFCLAEDENLTKAVMEIAWSLWHVQSEEIFEILLEAAKDYAKKLRLSPTIARKITRSTDPTILGVQLMVTLFPGHRMFVNYEYLYPNEETIAVLDEHNCEIEFTSWAKKNHLRKKLVREV